MWHLLAVRGLIDSFFSVFAYQYILYPPFSRPDSWLAFFPGVLAGLVSAGIVRAKLHQTDEIVLLDIERGYRRLVQTFDDRIAQKSVMLQSQWRLRIEKDFTSKSSADIAHLALTYVRNAHEQRELSDADLADFHQRIEETHQDETADSIPTLLQIVLDAGGRDFLKKEAKKAKKEPARPDEANS